MPDKTPAMTEHPGDPVEAIITEAIQRAQSGKPASVEMLTDLARLVQQESDPGRRVALGHAYLILMGAENGAEVAQEWIAGSEPYLREAGFEALTDFGGGALHEVRALAAHPRREVRWYGVEAARLLADPAVAGLLVDAMADDDFAIRWAASRGLVAIGDDALVPILEGLVRREPTLTYHRAALWALRRMHAPAQRDLLAQLVASLSHSTTTVQSPGLAEELLQALR
jgi:HEAT repeat protein